MCKNGGCLFSFGQKAFQISILGNKSISAINGMEDALFIFK